MELTPEQRALLMKHGCDPSKAIDWKALLQKLKDSLAAGVQFAQLLIALLSSQQPVARGAKAGCEEVCKAMAEAGGKAVEVAIACYECADNCCE